MNLQWNFQEIKFFIGNEDGNISGEPISIYDLADKPLKKTDNIGLDLKIGGSDEDKLSTAKLGSYIYKADDGRDVEKNNVMIYKYIFECENMEYNLSNGRVKSLKFTAIKNTNYPG